MIELESRILEVLANCPYGTRMRSIGNALHMWHCDLIKPLTHLEEKGLVKRDVVEDKGNMESYYIWKLK